MCMCLCVNSSPAKLKCCNVTAYFDAIILCGLAGASLPCATLSKLYHLSLETPYKTTWCIRMKQRNHKVNVNAIAEPVNL